MRSVATRTELANVRVGAVGERKPFLANNAEVPEECNKLRLDSRSYVLCVVNI